MEKVVKAASYFIEHAKALYDSLNVNETLDAKYVLKWIERAEGSTVDKQTVWQAIKKGWSRNIRGAICLTEWRHRHEKFRRFDKGGGRHDHRESKNRKIEGGKI